MLQRAHQYMAAEMLVAGKRDKTKRPRVEQPRGLPPPPPKRREDRSSIHLRRYVRDRSSLPDSRPPRDLSPQPKGPIEKQIDIIFGWPASGGDSSSARKAYA
ncbi:hypothetical protein BHM03_00043785 [Ensete ventricosum]|nr:hypothetical protein BHM03_00043785 [Ensete ventricosum]